LGDVDEPDGSLFASPGNGPSESVVTGAVYWSGRTILGVDLEGGAGNGVVTAKMVQQGDEGAESELLVVGGWGDVRVGFDGT